MKKLTLTFSALFALFAVAPVLFADGPEKYSGKEKEVMQPAPPVCDFYRAHEWDLSIWAAYAFGDSTGQTDVPNVDPFTPDTDPFVSAIGGPFVEPKSQNPNERVNIGQVSHNELFGRDDTWGGGVDVKYFWSKYFGLGLEGIGLAAKTNFAGGGLVTLTGRFPFGRFAPYVTGGVGFIDGGSTLYKFYNEKNYADASGNVINEREYWTVDPVSNNHIRGLGQIGAGLEFRVTCHIGLMADVSWNFVFGQEDHPDRLHLITETGHGIVTFAGIPISDTIIINTAEELRPGHGSDHQDFGLARFGVTFSY